MLYQKLVVTGLILAGVSLCVAAIRPSDRRAAVVSAPGRRQPPPDPGGEFRNLKVLPRHISSKDLNRIMIDEFEDDLGVTCNFCHAENKETHKPDYASDEKPEKEIARTMMRMTLKLNKEYFRIKRPVIGDRALAVTCNTCHNGQPHPNNAAGE
jgi:hypothetical protein